MHINITEECVVCGRCEEICPEVFEVGEDIAEVKINEIPEEYQDAARQAAEECPVSAIVVEE